MTNCGETSYATFDENDLDQLAKATSTNPILESSSKETNSKPNESFASLSTSSLSSSSSSSASTTSPSPANVKKRSFNVDSLLAPDLSCKNQKKFKPSTDYFNLPIADNTALTLQLNDADQSKEQANTSKKLTDQPLSEHQLVAKNVILNASKSSPRAGEELKHVPVLSTVKHPANVHSKTQNNQHHLNHNHHSGEHHHHHHHHQQHHHQNSPFSKQESNNVDVENWKLTFSKIMARSYKNNNNNSSNNSNTSDTSRGNSTLNVPH